MSRSLVEDPSGVRAVEARDAVEQRALPGAVGPDDADDLPLAHRERDVVVGEQPAEPLGDALDVQERRGAHFSFHPSLWRSPHTPLG